MTKQHRYLPLTLADRHEMLAQIGVNEMEDLLKDIPSQLRLKEALRIPEALSELELTRHMTQLAMKNKSANEAALFLGAGTYDHFIPSVVNHVLLRSEFMTAYVPYQPEASQGELQALFEFQSMVCELTGMAVANSSLYDAFTSLGEACNLAVGTTKKKRVLVSEAVHPQAREVLSTYAYGMEYGVEAIALSNHATDITLLEQAIDDETAAVVVQYPNFFGTVEDLQAIKNLLEGRKTLLIVVANPLALALLEAPGELGADIVVGDMQPLGISMSYGGPHCGYFAAKKAYMRKLPSRIVGQTVDADGKRGFVMTLQTREQHIRREKATSNMSSNQALFALASAVFMSAMGKEGIREMAQQNISKAHYLSTALAEAGINVLSQPDFFNEFVIQLKEPISEVNERLLTNDIIGGLDVSKRLGVSNAMLLCVTEKRSKSEMDKLVTVLTEVAQ
ncbi:aminomethyl-transferring glycine dehydrogenase subunit GcvPA [Fundicoccus sp. Sow4_D5]|uniref:aminomethyl-transferring glycine dehydrogenase subunit GcvPA n=1 Tax=unclassified Fundicoccus TaxID=2761543 RepID=UPI003F91B94D